ADIDDHAGAAGELRGRHQLAALGTGNVAANRRILFARDRNGRAENGGLIFAVGADLLKTWRVHPDAAAFLAVVKLYVPEIENLQWDFAARAEKVSFAHGSGRGEGVAAMGAEFRAQEGEAEAGWTG